MGKIRVIDPDAFLMHIRSIDDRQEVHNLVRLSDSKFEDRSYKTAKIRPLYKEEVLSAIASSIKEIDIPDNIVESNNSTKINGVSIDKGMEV